MTAVPHELRDELVRRLERAIAERDRALRTRADDADRLRGELGAARQSLAELGSRLRELDAAMAQADRETAARLADLRARVEAAGRRAERQLGELEASQGALEARVAAEAARLQAELGAVVKRRTDRDETLRRAAADAIKAGRALLAGWPEETLLRLDLGASAVVARAALDGAAQDPGSPEAVVTRAMAALADARLTVGTAAERDGALTAGRASAEADQAWLRALASGAPVGDLPDQRADVSCLLAPELRRFEAIVEREVQDRLPALLSWTTAGAARFRHERVVAHLAEEALAARRALITAAEHERRRYYLGHVWDQLERRFGTVRRDGARTEGEWDDPADRKSTYRFRLWTTAGHVLVAVPWVGELAVSHERAVQIHAPLSVSAGAGVHYLNGLRARWDALEGALAGEPTTPGSAMGEG